MSTLAGSVNPSTPNRTVVVSAAVNEDELADFSTNPRVWLLSAMALGIGMISSLVAYALLWLIDVITSLAFYHRFSSQASFPAEQSNHQNEHL